MLYQLPALIFAAGGNDVVQLKLLPKQIRGRIPHLRRFIFECDYTPTTTALPTAVGNNNLLSQCDFWDGRIYRFVGGANAIRQLEKLHTGRLRLPDADTDTASGTARYFRRVLHVGPPQGAGGISDYIIPTGCLDNGVLNVTFGALTSLAADCTAATGTIRVYADLELQDDVRIPPAYQAQRFISATGDVPMPGRALYLSVCMFHSSALAFDAWAAGDLSNVRFDLGQGELVPSILAPALTAAWMDDMESGQMDVAQGEPRAASDDNNKQVNHATPTALVAGSSDLQPVIWQRRGQKLTKSEVAESQARLQWDGTKTTSLIYAERILPQGESVIGAMGAAALSAINRSLKGMKVRTISKRQYTGPYLEFMPMTGKV